MSWDKHNVPKSTRLEKKFSGRVNLGFVREAGRSSGMAKLIDRQQQTIHESSRIRRKDKKDRATSDMVLDRRTLTVLYSMISMKLIDSVQGCISCGKEANVYYSHSSQTVQLMMDDLDDTSKESSIDDVRSGHPFKQFALKIYKTSILKFKDRRKYVEGEWRFEKGYSKNPRKMVEMWAEKEYRNLQRLSDAGIPCPKAYFVKQNVLLMDLLSHKDEEHVALPKLKDAFEKSSQLDRVAKRRKFKFSTMMTIPVVGFNDEINSEEDENDDDHQMDGDDHHIIMDDCDEEYQQQHSDALMMMDDAQLEELLNVYGQIVGYMREMYWKCRLIHGDLSEYNLLYDRHSQRVFVIDVSQSVEQSHPNAFRFLAMDCTNINEFFRKQGLITLTHKELFDFITLDIGYDFPDLRHLRESVKTAALSLVSDSSVMIQKNNDVVVGSEVSSSSKIISRAEDYKLKKQRGKKGKKSKHSVHSLKREERYKKDQMELVKHESILKLCDKWLRLSLDRIKMMCHQRTDQSDGTMDHSVFDEENDVVRGVDIPLSLHSIAMEDCDRDDHTADVLEWVKNLTLKRSSILQSSLDGQCGDQWSPDEEQRMKLMKEVSLMLNEQDEDCVDEECEHSVTDSPSSVSSQHLSPLIGLPTLEDIEHSDDGISDVSEGEEDQSECEDDNDEEEEACLGALFPEAPLVQLRERKRGEITREELREIRRRNKRIVKAEKRESRKHKIPKKVKKRKIKVARMKAGRSVK